MGGAFLVAQECGGGAAAVMARDAAKFFNSPLIPWVGVAAPLHQVAVPVRPWPSSSSPTDIFSGFATAIAIPTSSMHHTSHPAFDETQVTMKHCHLRGLAGTVICA